MSDQNSVNNHTIDDYLKVKSPQRRMSGLGRELYALPTSKAEKVDMVFAHDCQKGVTKSFEEYRRELEKALSQTRRYLASNGLLGLNNNLGLLAECERLLAEARGYASAMLIVADIEKEDKKKQAASMQRRGAVRTVAQTKEEDAKKNSVRKTINDEIGPLVLEVSRAIREAEKTELGIVRASPLRQPSPSTISDASSTTSSQQYVAPSYTSSEMRSSNDAKSAEVQRLIQSSDDLLTGAIQTRNETELIGNNIIDTMGNQRNQLYNASGYIDGTRTAVQDSSGILRRMQVIEKKKKYCLWLIIALLVLANIVMFWSIVAS